MFKTGDFVIPTPYQKEWKEIFPTYPPEMTGSCGSVGVVGQPPDKQDDKLDGCLYVEFNLDKDPEEYISWYYRPEWLRLATQEEAREYKFLIEVKRI